jgi:RHS repeat-associated protein
MTDPLYLKTGNAREQHYFYQNDHLGTPQKLMSTTGAIVWDARYEAFGQATPIPLLPGVQPIDNPLRFAGQYHDPETGWHYNWHRYYSPELGRYITSDPIGLEGGLNTYAYVGGNPVNMVDPMGLQHRCPKSPPVNDPRWLNYNKVKGPSWAFHCNFDTYIEDTAQRLNSWCDLHGEQKDIYLYECIQKNPYHSDYPVLECVYDEKGQLVDDSHLYAACGGSHNDYSGSSTDHALFDRGGPCNLSEWSCAVGWEAWKTSRQHSTDRRREKCALDPNCRRNLRPAYNEPLTFPNI